MANDTVPAGADRAFQPMSESWLEFDLEDEARRLWQEKASRAGRNAKTLVKHADFRLVLTVLKSKNRIQGHKASGRISIQTIRGHIRMHVSRSETMETIDLPAGHVLALDRGVHHDVEALVDSAFLLTVAWPEGVGRVAASAPSSAA
jgi:quercetin dioxygenase-like cupin family protein